MTCNQCHHRHHMNKILIISQTEGDQPNFSRNCFTILPVYGKYQSELNHNAIDKILLSEQCTTQGFRTPL